MEKNSIADDRRTQTGAAGAGSNAEILKRLDRIEDSLHNMAVELEAVWLKTGAVELDPDALTEDPEPEQ